jgi:hypothetical protein
MNEMQAAQWVALGFSRKERQKLAFPDTIRLSLHVKRVGTER